MFEILNKVELQETHKSRYMPFKQNRLTSRRRSKPSALLWLLLILVKRQLHAVVIALLLSIPRLRVSLSFVPIEPMIHCTDIREALPMA